MTERGKVLETDQWWRRYRGRSIVFTVDVTDAERPVAESERCLRCKAPASRHLAVGDGRAAPLEAVEGWFNPPWHGLYCPPTPR